MKILAKISRKKALVPFIQAGEESSYRWSLLQILLVHVNGAYRVFYFDGEQSWGWSPRYQSRSEAMQDFCDRLELHRDVTWFDGLLRLWFSDYQLSQEAEALRKQIEPPTLSRPVLVKPCVEMRPYIQARLRGDVYASRFTLS